MHIFRGSRLSLHFLCLNSMTKRGEELYRGVEEVAYFYFAGNRIHKATSWRKISFVKK